VRLNKGELLMKLNASLLFVEGGTVECRPFSIGMKPGELFNDRLYHIGQAVTSKGLICDNHGVGAHVIYKIDTNVVDGEVYPRIHIKPLSELGHNIDEFDPTVLIIGVDPNNQVKTKDVGDIPHIHSIVNYYFGDRNKLNGSYQVVYVGLIELGGKLYPNMVARKTECLYEGANAKTLRMVEQSIPVGYGE